MAIHRMTYLDLPPEQRRHSAKLARQRIQAMMTNPFLHPDQIKFLNQQMELVGLWEQGIMPEKPKKGALPLPPADDIPEIEVIEDDSF